jgi:hypothetical protein
LYLLLVPKIERKDGGGLCHPANKTEVTQGALVSKSSGRRAKVVPLLSSNGTALLMESKSCGRRVEEIVYPLLVSEGGWRRVVPPVVEMEVIVSTDPVMMDQPNQQE